MNITFAGHESKGAWLIRAKEIAPYLNAKLDPLFLNSNNCNLVIIVKRPEPEVINRIKRQSIPIIWDIQDSFPQLPKNNYGELSKDKILDYYVKLLKEISPTIVISTNSQMKKDIEELGFKSVIINHHHRKNITVNPLREKLITLGIEGSPFQYGKWQKKLHSICKKLNLTFKPNLNASKDKLHFFDVVVNIRSFDGYAAKYWKSNIKLANAHGSGTPAICSRSQSYLDTASGYERWADTEEEIITAIEELRPYEVRKEIHEHFLKHKIGIDDVVKEYQNLIDSIK